MPMITGRSSSASRRRSWCRARAGRRPPRRRSRREREPDVHPDHGDDRQQRRPQHVEAQHPPLAGALRAGGAHEVLVQRLRHARPDHADVDRGEQHRERDPRQQHVQRPLARPAAGRARGRMEEVAVALCGQDVEPVAEEIREHEPDPDRVHGHAEQDEHRGAPVDERARPHRRDHADRDRDQQPDHRAADDDRRRHRRPPLEDVDDVLAGLRRPAEGAVREPPEELAVLLPHGTVDRDRVAGLALGDGPSAGSVRGRRSGSRRRSCRSRP